MRALVVSPTPFLPDIAGNRRLVRNRLAQLREAGARVDFLYIPMEGPADAAMHASDLVDEVHVGDVAPLQPGATELADPDALTGVTGLPDALRGRRYALALVNYAFCTGCLAGVDADLTVLETHDRFANRHDVLAVAGCEPSWIALTVAAEARAAARVDLVGVVREDDRAHFEALGANAVAMLRPMEWRQRSAEGTLARRGGAIRLGFVGSDNAVNAQALRALLRAVAARRGELGRFELHVLGRVCETLGPEERALSIPHGIVESRDDLYDRFDVLLNPTVSGTGVKIKTIEALAFGKPVVCCAEGAAGLPDVPPFMRLPSIAAMVDALARLDADPTVLDDLATRSAAAFDAYQAAAVSDFAGLLARIRAGGSPRRAGTPSIAWDGGPCGAASAGPGPADAIGLLRRGRPAMADAVARRRLAEHPLDRAAYLVGACCAALLGVWDRAERLAACYLESLAAPAGRDAHAAILGRYGANLRSALAAAPGTDADGAASRMRGRLLAILAEPTGPDAPKPSREDHAALAPEPMRRILPRDATPAAEAPPRLVCAPGWSPRWAPVTARPAVTLTLVPHADCRQVNAALAGLAVGDARYGFIFLKFIDADGWLLELHRADCTEGTFTTPAEAWDESAWGPHVRVRLDATAREALDTRLHASDTDLVVACLAEVLDHAGGATHANAPPLADLVGSLASAVR